MKAQNFLNFFTSKRKFLRVAFTNAKTNDHMEKFTVPLIRNNLKRRNALVKKDVSLIIAFYLVMHCHLIQYALSINESQALRHF